jgi:hypothetical protein
LIEPENDGVASADAVEVAPEAAVVLSVLSSEPQAVTPRARTADAPNAANVRVRTWSP